MAVAAQAGVTLVVEVQAALRLGWAEEGVMDGQQVGALMVLAVLVAEEGDVLHTTTLLKD